MPEKLFGSAEAVGSDNSAVAGEQIPSSEDFSPPLLSFWPFLSNSRHRRKENTACAIETVSGWIPCGLIPRLSRWN